MSGREVTEYLSHHLVPQLLESLLTGLLYHRPEDPIGFLQSCLIRTGQLGGPGTITWDTFIHLDRDQLRPDPLKTHPGPTVAPPLAPTQPSLAPIPQTLPIVPQLTPHVPRATHSFLQTLPPLPPTVPPVPPISTGTTLISSGPSKVPALHPLTPSVSSIHLKKPSGHRVLVPAPPGAAVTSPVPSPVPSPVLPAVHIEVQDEETKAGSSEVRSQVSIDSDSDMTDSSGLLQEVSILPLQKPHPLVIFIIGGPGSGKGSQTLKLSRCFGLRAISLDDLLREQLLSHASPSRKWEVISEMMCHGELGPQEETISELKRQLVGQPEVRGFIVDGFPRDVHQALSFQEQIGSPDLVLLLLCSNETLSHRLQRRAAKLDLLGDSSRTFQRRLDTFHRDVVSVRRYYAQTHLLTQVDADRDEDVVFADLSSVIREKLQLKDQSDPAGVPDVPFNLRSADQ